MECGDEVGVQDVASRDPRALLRAITLPINQVLETPSPSSRPDETMNRVGRPSINELGGRRGSGGGLELGLFNGFDLGYMEGGMDPHGARKTETDCSRIDDFIDGERTHKPGSQLPRLHPERKVPCRQPNLLTRSVTGCRGPTAIGISLVSVGRAQESSTGPHPGAPTSLDERLDRRDTGLSLLLREQWRLISSRALEGGKTCC